MAEREKDLEERIGRDWEKVYKEACETTFIPTLMKRDITMYVLQ